MPEAPKPERPYKIISHDGAWEIIPRVEVYRVQELDARDEEDRTRIKSHGPMIRILYCAKTYEIAKDKAIQLVNNGHHRERIEFVFAERDTISAILNCKFDVRPNPLAVKKEELINGES